MGGYNLKIHVSSSQPGVQLELPQVCLNWDPVVTCSSLKDVQFFNMRTDDPLKKWVLDSNLQKESNK